MHESGRTMAMMFKPCLLCLTLVFTRLAAMTIEIDYTHDTGNFFNTAEKRAAVKAVAGFYEKIITDKLLRINQADFPGSSWTAVFSHPSTGGTASIDNLVVPEDTIIIYVGGSALPSQISGQGGPGGYGASGSQAWLDRVIARGNSGVLASPPTDTAPWGGSITFNNTVAWNFSLTTNQSGREFITVALHEMAHVLGIGTANSWGALLASGTFTGAAAVQSHGSAPPADGGHLLTSLTSPLHGSFGRPHGLVRPVLMLPASTDTGANFDVATDLDLSCLLDIGWEIRPAPVLATSALSPAAVAFSWPSVSFLDYRIERSIDLASFPVSSGILPGNGTILNWSDSAPPAGRAFYRLAAEPNLPPTAAMALDVQWTPAVNSQKSTSIYRAPRIITDCGSPGE